MIEKPHESFVDRLTRVMFSGIGVIMLCGLLMGVNWVMGEGRCSWSHYVEPYSFHCKGEARYYFQEITSRKSPDEKYFVTLYSYGEEIVVEVQEAVNDQLGETVFNYTYTHYADTFLTNTPVTWNDNSEEFSFDYDFTYKDIRTECLFTYNIPNDKFILQCSNPD